MRLLRGRQLQAEDLLGLGGDLRILCGELLIGQLVQNRAGVGVRVLHDIPRVVLVVVVGLAESGVDRVLDCVALRCHVIVYAGNRLSGVAAALLLVARHGIELLHQRSLLVRSGQFRIGEAVEHGGVLGVEAVAKTALNGVALALQAGSRAVNLALQGGKIRSQHIVVHRARAVRAIAVSETIVAPAAEHEQKEDDNPPCTVVPKAETTIAIAASHIGGCDRHHHGSVRRKTHKQISFVKIYLHNHLARCNVLIS